MRILAITNLYPSPYHPTRATFNRQQFAALAAQHDVRVIAPIAWTDEFAGRWRQGKLLPPGRTVTCDGITVEHPRYWFPPRLFRGSYGRCFRRSIKAAFKRAIDEFRPDIVLASWAYPDGWAAVDLAHRAGLKAVVKVLGSDILLVSPGLKRQQTLASLRKADGVIAVNRELAAKLTAWHVEPNRVHVIHEGLDTKLFCPGPKSEACARLKLDPSIPIILFVGNLVPVKAPDVLIEACAKLAVEGKKFKCYMIGQGALRTQLERRLTSKGLNDSVTLVGPVPHSQMPDWHRAADLVVLPSRSEGTPNVLREAMACGTPFVASRVGGIPEITPSQDWLVPPDDPAALAQKIAKLLDDRPRVMGFHAKSWEESAESVVVILRELVDAGRKKVASPEREGTRDDAPVTARRCRELSPK